MEPFLKPLEYLDFKNDDIIDHLINGNGCSVNNAGSIIKLLHDFVNKLSKVRNSETGTNKILNEISELPDLQQARLVRHWLLQAVAKDDSYCYVYNGIAQHYNRQDLTFPLKLKAITDRDLYTLLKQEENDLGGKAQLGAADVTDTLSKSQTIFGKDLDNELQIFYTKINGKLFEKTDLSDYIDCFNVNIPVRKLNFIKGATQDFGYFLSELEKLIPDESIKSFNQWSAERFLFKGSELGRKLVSSYKTGKTERTLTAKNEINAAINCLTPKETPKKIVNTSLNIDN
ncbi:MAG: hypothetical protein AB7V25_00410 [Mangrovibacterium sp.]